MLYLDYSRREGEWLGNQFGGRENLESIEFFRMVNSVIQQDMPGVFTIAEESTAWGGVTHAASSGGLGFTFKWNMGWMHDTLDFFKKDPSARKVHLDQLTFAMQYEFSERFINAISHDEVVHGKGSLIQKMPGDAWQKLANIRLLLAYQYTRPGKQLLFMGTELGQSSEWNYDRTLDWANAQLPHARSLQAYLAALTQLYRENPVFWRSDAFPEGFEWIDFSDRQNAVVSYIRRDGPDFAIVVLNFTPLPHDDYRIGVPLDGTYVTLLSSDEARFGGSNFRASLGYQSEPYPVHGHGHSLKLSIPPLGAVILALAK
jgi:1,4-alpha-glucan branching enzyme